MKSFRLLKANEIECRVQSVKANGLVLLLYKDARCDMNILDETVGMMNWKKEYTRDNRNCIVSIWDDKKQQWISKEDTGTESFTEKEKGLASDSFKRACFNFGIGRELYSAPFTWVAAENASITPKDGKYTCFDRFSVEEIAYDNNENICYLSIRNENKKCTAFTWGRQLQAVGVDEKSLKTLVALLEGKQISPDYVWKLYKVKEPEKLTKVKYTDIIKNLDKIKERFDKEVA